MRFSVIVPAFNAARTLPALMDSLLRQSFQDFEVILVDDCSCDSTPEIAQTYPCKIIRLSENHGPAHCRNLGARSAQGDILAFTDSDCEVAPDWLKTMDRCFFNESTSSIMGRLVLKPSSYLGNSISALGFPAGGAIGFEKIWKVDKDGLTDSLSSCNCAIRKEAYRKIGGFDESFPYPGGEDTLLAYGLKKTGYTIKYCPDVLAYHGARDSFPDFMRWQFRRGISSYIFCTKVQDKRDFLALRLWSTGNIIRTFLGDRKLPLILFLLMTSFLTQVAGFLYGKHKGLAYARAHH